MDNRFPVFPSPAEATFAPERQSVPPPASTDSRDEPPSLVERQPRGQRIPHFFEHGLTPVPEGAAVREDSVSASSIDDDDSQSSSGSGKRKRMDAGSAEGAPAAKRRKIPIEANGAALRKPRFKRQALPGEGRFKCLPMSTRSSIPGLPYWILRNAPPASRPAAVQQRVSEAPRPRMNAPVSSAAVAAASLNSPPGLPSSSSLYLKPSPKQQWMVNLNIGSDELDFLQSQLDISRGGELLQVTGRNAASSPPLDAATFLQRIERRPAITLRETVQFLALHRTFPPEQGGIAIERFISTVVRLQTRASEGRHPDLARGLAPTLVLATMTVLVLNAAERARHEWRNVKVAYEAEQALQDAVRLPELRQWFRESIAWLRPPRRTQLQVMVDRPYRGGERISVANNVGSDSANVAASSTLRLRQHPSAFLFVRMKQGEAPSSAAEAAGAGPFDGVGSSRNPSGPQ